MKNTLTRKLKKSALAGIVGASTLYGSGCASMLDSRCKDKTIHVTSSEDNNGGVEIKLVSSGLGNKLIQKGITPCYITVYRNGDNISGMRTPLQSGVGNYALFAAKKNVSPKEFRKDPYNYLDVKHINYKISPFVGLSLLLFPIGPMIESGLGGGKYYEEDQIHFDFNAPSSERRNKFNVNFRK